MASAFQAQVAHTWHDEYGDQGSECGEIVTKGYASDYPSVFKSGSFNPGSSGTKKRASNPRRMPSKSVRKARKDILPADVLKKLENQREGKQAEGSKKRKCEAREEGRGATSKASCLEVVPKEGLPNAQ